MSKKLTSKEITFVINSSMAYGGAFKSLYSNLIKLPNNYNFKILIFAKKSQVDQSLKEQLKSLNCRLYFLDGYYFSRFSKNYLAYSKSNIIKIIYDFFRSIPTLIKFIRYCKKNKVKYLYFNSSTFLLFQYLVKLFYHNYLDITVHCREYSLPELNILKHFFLKKFLSSVNRFICISRIIQNSYDSVGSKESFFLPNPIIDNQFNQEKKEFVKENIISFLGGGNIRKGAILFLDSLKEINFDLKLYFCGQNLNTKNLISKINEVGKIPNINIINCGLITNPVDIINKSSVIAVTHIEPHFSRVIIEALYLKKAIVTIEDEFTKEYSEFPNVFLSQKSPLNLSKSIIEALDFTKNANEDQFENGYSYCKDNFLDMKIYNNWFKIINKILI